METTPNGRPRVTRRTLLGSTAVVAATLTGGCAQRARSLINRQSGRQIDLTITTVPADRDRRATEIARMLAEHLGAVGVNAEVELKREDELRRDVLINHAFDVYVVRYPAHHDPDFLRPLLHSRFNGEPGWQNPFGFTNLEIDDFLVDQHRTSGGSRRSIVNALQRAFARQQPFTVVGFPEEIRAARTDRFTGWTDGSLSDPLGYVSLRQRTTTDGRDDDVPDRLRVTITDNRVTRNFNPIAVEFRNRGTFVGLLYDSLARRYDDAVRPWLAADWTWDATEDGTTGTIRLRDALTWHDGTPLTAADVAFTYRFLGDTTLGDRETPIPAPRFRGRTSLVESLEPVDDRTLRIDFGETAPAVAERAFTVPVLPAHEWEPRAKEVDVVGLDLFDGVTDALVWENPRPVGSGVLRFERSITDERLILSRFDEHFLNRDPPDELAARFGGSLAFEELVVHVVPSDAAAVELIAAGEADATASSAEPSVIPRIGRRDDLQLLVDPSRAFYHVGFNTRHAPLSNQRFRRTVARLVDKRAIEDEVFDGFLRPATTPIAGSEWTPSDLRWNGADPEVPFIGTDGELDVAEARDRFEDAGYRYNDAGELLNP